MNPTWAPDLLRIGGGILAFFSGKTDIATNNNDNDNNCLYDSYYYFSFFYYYYCYHSSSTLTVTIITTINNPQWRGGVYKPVRRWFMNRPPFGDDEAGRLLIAGGKLAGPRHPGQLKVVLTNGYSL